MRTLFVLSLLLPLFAFVSVDSREVKVNKVDGVEIYVIHKPKAQFETLGTVHLSKEAGENISLSDLIALAKNKFGDDCQAILTRDGRTARCIKFTEASNGMAHYAKVNQEDVYLLSQPTQTYAKVESMEVSSEMTNMPYNVLLIKLSDLVKEKKDSGSLIDAVVFDGKSELYFIKY